MRKPPSNKIDISLLINKKFNMLTILKEGRVGNNYKRFVICKCDCGNTVHVLLHSVTSLRTKSCGCLHRELTSKAKRTHGETRYSKVSTEYMTYVRMKGRCYNKKNRKYGIYGGRGITVCDRWLDSFENFLEDMGRKPSKIHSLDRINVNGNYEPLNCRWATPKEQANNTRKNLHYEYNGDTYTLDALSKIFNVKPYTLRLYLKSHTTKEAEDRYLNKITNVRKIGKLDSDFNVVFEYKSIYQLAKKTGISHHTIKKRILKNNEIDGIYYKFLN